MIYGSWFLRRCSVSSALFSAASGDQSGEDSGAGIEGKRRAHHRAVNALILHLRWGGIIRERGLVVCAIGGNIVTSWSWFGVNMLHRPAQLRFHGRGVQMAGAVRGEPVGIHRAGAVAGKIVEKFSHPSRA